MKDAHDSGEGKLAASKINVGVRDLDLIAGGGFCVGIDNVCADEGGLLDDGVVLDFKEVVLRRARDAFLTGGLLGDAHDAVAEVRGGIKRHAIERRGIPACRAGTVEGGGDQVLCVREVACNRNGLPGQVVANRTVGKPSFIAGLAVLIGARGSGKRGSREEGGSDRKGSNRKSL